MANFGQKDVFIADVNSGLIGDFILFDGERKVQAELNHENACILRDIFPFTGPKQVLNEACTFGVGDRLGIATTGHINVFNKFAKVVPVFAQQSMRELIQTNRKFEEVLDKVTYATFKNGFKRGFGADGDHLKTLSEIENALSCGYSMITLDCSEHIRNDIYSVSNDQINTLYSPDPECEEIYIGKNIDIGNNISFYFHKDEYRRTALIFNELIKFVCKIQERFFTNRQYKADLEISIDETAFPTTPLQHYFVANELIRRGVKFSTLAPRFRGEFQKGIDYIGDLLQFEEDFGIHAKIASHLKYKLSIHSGSDKFSIYPIISRLTKGNLHIKTSGTSWLEAMRVVALVDPGLYRKIHNFALGVFNDARKNYYVTTDIAKVSNIDQLNDKDLVTLFSNKDSRQLIHITYGYILNAKNSFGNYVFKDELFKLWSENDSLYSEMLEKHIGKHLNLICNPIY